MTSIDRSGTGVVCVDANLVVDIVAEPRSRLRAQWQQWERDGVELVAPSLLPFEVANGIYRIARAGGNTIESVLALTENATALPIRYVDARALNSRAIRLAARFSRLATYDAYYLALAESLGAQLWTLDQRLYNAVSPHLPWVVFAGETG